MGNYQPDFEIVISNDGSTDNTVELIKSYQKSEPRIVILDNVHFGKSYNIWRAMSAAKGDYILMTDADLAAPIQEIKKLLVWSTDHGYDIVIASREGIGAKRIKEPLIRHIMGRIFNLWIRIVAVKGISDTQCGFKLFKKELKHLFDKLTIEGFAFDFELIFLTKKYNFKVKEMPVVWVNNFNSAVRWYDYPKTMMSLIVIRINNLLGKYN